MSTGNPGTCPSHKSFYSNKDMADRSARKDEAKYGWQMRTYECPHCEWFHKARVLHRGTPVLMMGWLDKQRG